MDLIAQKLPCNYDAVYRTVSAPHCPQKTAPWVAEGAPHRAGVAQGGDAIEEQPSNRQLAVVPEGAEPRSMEKASLPRMAITWAGAVHNMSNCSLRRVDGLLPDHLSDQLGSQQDWNRRVWSVWVLVGLCAMLGVWALLCHQQKYNCLRWSHNACHEKCHVVPNASAGAAPLGCFQVLWLSVAHQHFRCL